MMDSASIYVSCLETCDFVPEINDNSKKWALIWKKNVGFGRDYNYNLLHSKSTWAFSGLAPDHMRQMQ